MGRQLKNNEISCIPCLTKPNDPCQLTADRNKCSDTSGLVLLMGYRRDCRLILILVKNNGD